MKSDVTAAACRIPFNVPAVVGTELHYVAQALQSGHLAGDGNFTRRCQQLLEDSLGVSKVRLTTSCTAALEMAALLLEIEPGDEVILPSFTFVSTANAFILRGATPRFIDVRPDTLNMDETLLESLVTPRTKAIVPVHYAGVGCEMEAIGSIATKYGVPIVEDNAHGLYGYYKGRALGTFGALATQSFHETKNFTCGEGGALLVNDMRLASRAEIIREKGTNRSQFFRGEVDKYTWVDVGSSYLPSEILAAVLFAQLESRQVLQARRQRLWRRYAEGLEGWSARIGAQLPSVPPHCESAYHLYHVLLPSPETRERLITHLKSLGVAAVFHYQPLHLSPVGRRLGGQPGSCPVTESICDRLVRLPLYPGLTDEAQDRVLDAVASLVGGSSG